MHNKEKHPIIKTEKKKGLEDISPDVRELFGLRKEKDLKLSRNLSKILKLMVVPRSILQMSPLICFLLS